MRVTLKEIYTNLLAFSPKIISGDFENTFFVDLLFATSGQSTFEEKILYIIEARHFLQLDTSPMEGNFLVINGDCLDLISLADKNLTILEVREKEIFQVFNKAKEVFTNNLKYIDASSKLLNTLLRNKGLSPILETAAKLLKNPLILIDNSYKVLSYSDLSVITDPLWLKNIERGYCSYEFIAEVTKIVSIKTSPKSSTPFPVSCSASDVGKMVSKILIDSDVVGYVIMLECETPFTPELDNILKLTSELISEEMQKDRFYKNMKGLMYEGLLFDLIEGKVDNKETALERMKSCGQQFFPYFYVAVIDISKYQGTHPNKHYLRDTLEGIYPNLRSIFYKEQILLLFNLSTATKLSLEVLEKFQSLLKKENLTLGMSTLFSDLFHLKDYYEEARKALTLSTLLKKEEGAIFYYEDFKFYDLLDAFPKKEELLKYCHPALPQLMEYDANNNTDYYDTLKAYLLNNRSAHITAHKLFIHRNTMNYRLNKIQEIIGIDLKDGEKIFQLAYSYKIMNYVNLTDHNG